MKTIFRIFIWGFLFLPMCAFAQKATEQRKYEINVEWEDMQGYSEKVSYDLPIYYDANDNVVQHGPLRINHRHDLTSRVGQKCIIAYTVSGNYVNGKLDGVLSLEKSVTVSVGELKVKGTLNFIKGVPNGTWTFTEFETDRGETRSAKLVIVIKDAKIVSFNINDGKEYFTLNTDKNTFSGRLDGQVYKNSVNTSQFIRKTGERTALDETAKNLINAFLAGTMSESDLIAKGFGFVRSGRMIANYDWDNLSYYISKLGVYYFGDSHSSLIHEAKNNASLSPALTLKRVNVKSAEEMISIANTIKVSDNISNSAEEILWYGNNSTWYRYYYGINQIEMSEGIYYFTNDAKLKFEEALKAGLEEKRLQAERLAEEKRLQAERLAEEKRLQAERLAEEKRLKEIEKQRKDIQAICDYLVLGKTAFSICYDDQVGNYFDPKGLSSTWALDLEKALKPFCKIIACKFVSYETQGGTDVAVLDITKFNKKGNITYRVPVTIVKGKILVTSINFSKAIVVQ